METVGTQTDESRLIANKTVVKSFREEKYTHLNEVEKKRRQISSLYPYSLEEFSMDSYFLYTIMLNIYYV